jgi:hypothetical protein
MIRRSPLGLLPLLVAALAACAPHVEGNGVYAERVFDAAKLAPFDRAAIGFPPDEHGVVVRASIFANDSTRQVVLSGDENVIQHVDVSADGGTLRTRMKLDSYTSVHPPQLRIRTPDLVAVETVGGAELTVLGAETQSFAVTAAAKGEVTLAGAGGEVLLVDLSGGARLLAGGYPVESAQLALTGASRATVKSSSQLSGSAVGGSVVYVTGGATCGVPLTLDATSTCGPPP